MVEEKNLIGFCFFHRDENSRQAENLLQVEKALLLKLLPWACDMDFFLYGILWESVKLKGSERRA
ncbi:MAG: hypothetical protein OEZ30_03710 [Candidatus Aminicenantes bacterium]|nr:hypothetical protein [Candidatus Aminicenantes bacterium]